MIAGIVLSPRRHPEILMGMIPSMRFWRSRWLGPVFIHVAALAAIACVLFYHPAKPEGKVCRDRLQRISQALLKYKEKHGSYPPAFASRGGPPQSWRVLLLPFLGRQDVYDAYHFNEPWNSFHNRRLAERVDDLYSCPDDTERRPGRTNYVTVLEAPTIWWKTRMNLAFGDTLEDPSNTIQLLELNPSDIPWMEPRDVKLEELIPARSQGLGPLWCGPHGDFLHASFCDGSVARVAKTISRGDLYALLVPSFADPGQEPPGSHAFPAQIDARQWTATTVLPHLERAIVPGHSLVYCATFQIAWDQVRGKEAAPLLLEGNPPMAVALNRGAFPRSALAEKSLVARMGAVRDGVAAAIKQEMDKKFPGVEFSLPVSPTTEVLAFAFLEKQLPFETRFQVLKGPLLFHGSGKAIPVRAFGIQEYKHGSNPEAWESEVSVLSYASDDDFIIRLLPTTDEIVLAKVRPAATLGQTLKQVQERIRKGPGATHVQLQEKEKLAVPRLSFNVLRRYDELKDKHILSGPWQSLTIGEAQQWIRFSLDESGSRLSSGSYMEAFDGHEVPPKPRQFLLDKPFLLFLKERQAEQPYLVLWIDSGEFMEEGKR